MSNKMWGGRFGSGPDPIMEEINASIDFDRHLYRQDIAASKAHAAMLAKTGIISGAGCEADRSRSRHDPVRDRGRQVQVQARARGHPYECRGPAWRADRAGRRAAAHRALAQRSGRDRFPALGARCDRRHRCGARRLSAGARRKGARACRHGDAGLHPFADRAAGDVRPSSARLCGDGGARPRPLCRRARAAQRKPARRRRARRHVVPARPRHDGQGARLCPADGEFARRRRRSRLRAGGAVGVLRSPPCICRALPKRSCSGRRRWSA